MEIKQYLSIIYKRLWILALLPVIAGAVSAYVSFYVMEPIYESNTTLYVINKKFDTQTSIAQSDLMAGQLLVKDYSELIKSRVVTSAVRDGLEQKGISAGVSAANISVSAKNDTRILQIKVQDKVPANAQIIADEVGEVFKKMAVDLMKVDNIDTIDKAQLPSAPVKPNPYTNIAIAIFAGIMAAVGIIFLIEYLDNTIKTAEDVEKHLGLTVLGTIPALDLK